MSLLTATSRKESSPSSSTTPPTRVTGGEGITVQQLNRAIKRAPEEDFKLFKYRLKQNRRVLDCPGRGKARREATLAPNVTLRFCPPVTFPQFRFGAVSKEVGGGGTHAHTTKQKNNNPPLSIKALRS